MTRTRRTQSAVLAILCLLLTACGARLDNDVRRQAADVALNGRGGGAAAGTSSGAVGGSGENPSQALGGGAAGSGGGLAAPGGSTGGGGSGTAGGGGQPGGGGTGGTKGSAAPAPAGGNGGATDIGVTATSITVGNVSDLSGPIPGLFAGAAYGTDAYFAYINSQGGVFGRQLRLQISDGQTECGQNKNAHTNLVAKVFTFVGSFSLYDGCGAPVLDGKPNSFDLSYALGAGKKSSKSSYAVQPAPQGYPSGMFQYWKQKYGSKTKKVGSLVGNVPATLESHRMIKATAESVGWEWVYDETYPATQTRYDAEMLQMQRQGVELVYIIGATGANAAAMKKQADSQGFKPVWVIPIAYTSEFFDRMGGASAAEGIVGANLYSLFFNEDEARAIPELALYQQWMRKTRPDAPLDLYSMYAWSSAKLFVEALKKAGPKPTRASVLAAVKAIGTYDAGGVINPGNPGAKKPSQCYVLWQIKGGKYVREATPPGKYRCDGAFVPYRG